jgi:biotin transport system permease protein
MTGLVSAYQPGNGPWHGVGAGTKYLVALAVLVPPLLAQMWWVTLIAVAVAGVLLLSTRLAPKTLGLSLGFVVLLAVLGGFQVLLGHPELGVVVPGNLLVAVWASRLVLVTTPGGELVDALVSAARPLAAFGISPERIGLAVAIMLRSVPVLLGSFATVRQAARARGLERNLLVNVAPVVVQAVAYAVATGEALAARGLGERGHRMAP